MERDKLIKRMQGRVDKCRVLARSIDDALAGNVSHAMADEGEADITRLIAEKDR